MSNFNVSLIVPCFNASKFLEYMFDSIKVQTIGISNVEIIFVYDTNSSDNTLNILKSFQEVYPHIMIVLCDNPLHTAGIPRNVGLKNVTSDYVVFLDSDDALEKNALKGLYDNIVKFDVDILKSNYSLCVNNKIIKLPSVSDEPIVLRPHTSDLVRISDDMVWATIYNKSFLDENNILFSDSLLGEDAEFAMTCLIKTNRNIVILDYFYTVIYTSDNMYSHSHTVTLKKLRANVNSHIVILDLLLNSEEHIDYINSTYKRYLLNGISNILRSDESFENRKLMIKEFNGLVDRFSDLNPNLHSIWKLFYDLFVNEHYLLIQLLSYMIRFVFNSKIFTDFQLNIRRRGWDTLKNN